METTQQKQTSSAGEGQAAFKPPKKKRKWLKRLIIIVVIAAVILFLLSRCMAGTQSLVGMAYIPVTVTRQDMTVAVSGTGTIQPIDSYKVTALVKGEILEAPFQEGDTVHKDDVLFRVDAQSVENSIQQQEIALEQAKVNLNNLLKSQSDAEKNQRVEATAAGVVTRVYTEMGVFTVSPEEGFVLIEKFSDYSVEDIQAAADAPIHIAADVKEIQLGVPL